MVESWRIEQLDSEYKPDSCHLVLLLGPLTQRLDIVPTITKFSSVTSQGSSHHHRLNLIETQSNSIFSGFMFEI